MYAWRNLGILESHDKNSQGKQCMGWDLKHKLLNSNLSATAFDQKTITTARINLRFKELREDLLILASGWKHWVLVAKVYTHKHYAVHLVGIFGYLNSYHVGVVVIKVEVGQVLLQGLPFRPLSTLKLMLLTHASFIYHRRYMTSATDSVIKQNTSLSRSLWITMWLL